MEAATDLGISWPDVSNAIIPREIFTDTELFAAENERIFHGPTWHLIGHGSELPNPGDYKRSSIGDVPVFSVRGKDGVIRTMINACAHRGTEVVNCKYGGDSAIRCIYHKWTYDLEGNLIGVALPDEFPESFRKEAHGLTKVRTDIAHGCVFASLSEDVMPVAEYLGTTIMDCIADALGDEDLVFLGSQSVTFRCNWKLYAENIFDSYHAPVLHAAARMARTRVAPGSRFDVAWSDDEDKRYAHAWTRYHSLPILERDLLNDYSILEQRGREDAYSYVIGLFPGDVINAQLDTIQLRCVRPKTVNETTVQFANFGRASDSPELREHRLRQAHMLGPNGLITLEDGCALERVQWGASAAGDNAVLKGAIPGRPPYGYAEEGGIRELYSCYRRLMGI